MWKKNTIAIIVALIALLVASVLAWMGLLEMGWRWLLLPLGGLISGGVSMMAVMGLGSFSKLRTTHVSYNKYLANLHSVAFILLTIAAAVAASTESVPHRAFAIIIAALIYWDLATFIDRLSRFKVIYNAKKLKTRHYLRLAIILAVSGALYIATSVINLSLGIWSVLFLSLILLFGLTRAIGYMRRKTD